jgi:flagellar hook assembly protein FlgD
VRVYSADGRLVATLLRGTVEPGVREVMWDGRDAGGRPVATGVYFCRLDAGGGTLTRKMILGR